MAMSANASVENNLVRQAVIEVASLPEEDLPLIVEFMNYLKQRRRAATERKLSAAEIRGEARRRASALKDVPRQDLVARFKELSESIRAQAVAQGTAFEGDWQRD